MVKILLIDDEEDFVLNLKELLEISGYLTNYSSNAMNGLQLLNQSEYNIIICDMHMPNMTGLQFLEQVKKDAGYLDIPVIILSANLSYEEELKLKSLGVQALLQKGAPFKTIKETVQNLVVC